MSKTRGMSLGNEILWVCECVVDDLVSVTVIQTRSNCVAWRWQMTKWQMSWCRYADTAQCWTPNIVGRTQISATPRLDNPQAARGLNLWEINRYQEQERAVWCWSRSAPQPTGDRQDISDLQCPGNEWPFWPALTGASLIAYGCLHSVVHSQVSVRHCAQKLQN